MAAGSSRKGAGQRRHQAQLQAPIEGTDALRGRVQTWPTYATVWAAVDAKPFVVSEEQATVMYDVTIPYRADVEVQHRVVVRGLTLKVLALEQPELRARDLVLHCAQVKGL